MERSRKRVWLVRGCAGLAGLVVVGVGAVGALGASLPREHSATGEAVIAASPDDVWATVVDFEALPEWAPDFTSVRRLPDADGRPRFRQEGGDVSLDFTFVEVRPPERLVVDLADDAGYFGGRWTYELEPVASGTRVRIREDGWCEPAFFRCMLYLFGYDHTIRGYLGALQAKHGD